MREKILLFGGSFDPVHKGHVEILKEVYLKLGFDRAIVIPAAKSPFKQGSTVATQGQRYDMLKLAFNGLLWCEVSDIEFNMPQPSYTVNTLEKLTALHPNWDLHWLCGSDILSDLHKWYCIDRILELVTLVTVCRPGSGEPKFDIIEKRLPANKQMKKIVVHTNLYDISSTEIRQGINQSNIDSENIPADVLNYIKCNKLYGSILQ